MDGFELCPACYSEVEVVKIQREDNGDNGYYLVNCITCGEGSKEALLDVDELKLQWNRWVVAKKAS